MRPLVIGIAGGTGSGKTTVARALADAIPEGKVALLQHDSYYRDRSDLTFEERCNLNFDHPDALDTELLVEHLTKLEEGRPVDIPIYDFKTHLRLPETQRVHPTPVIIVEGILVFCDEVLRQHFNIKIFVDTDADLRVFRRIRRDMEQRGRSFRSIRENYYSTIRPMHQRFVEPSKQWADVILPEGGENRVALDLILTKVQNVLATSR